MIDGVIFHTDHGPTYAADDSTKLCRTLGVRQSKGRLGSCFDNAASEAFFSTLEHEVLSGHHFTTKAHAREVITAWCYELRQHSTPTHLSRVAATHRIRKRSLPPDRMPHKGSLHVSRESPVLPGKPKSMNHHGRSNHHSVNQIHNYCQLLRWMNHLPLTGPRAPRGRAVDAPDRGLPDLGISAPIAQALLHTSLIAVALPKQVRNLRHQCYVWCGPNQFVPATERQEGDRDHWLS